MIIYILAAIIPAILLMQYVYKQDRVEKEPPGLLASLAFRGVLAALISIILEPHIIRVVRVGQFL